MALLQGLLKSLIKYLFPVEQKRVILKQNIFAYLNPEGKGVFRILSECEVKYASCFLNTADSIFTYNLLYSKRTNPFQSLFGSFAYHSLALERHFFPAAHGCLQIIYSFIGCFDGSQFKTIQGVERLCLKTKVWSESFCLWSISLSLAEFHITLSIPKLQEKSCKRWFRRRNHQSNLKLKGKDKGIYSNFNFIGSENVLRSVHIFRYINSFLIISNSFAYIDKSSSIFSEKREKI